MKAIKLQPSGNALGSDKLTFIALRASNDIDLFTLCEENSLFHKSSKMNLLPVAESR